jgi:hypothetical protein
MWSFFSMTGKPVDVALWKLLSWCCGVLDTLGMLQLQHLSFVTTNPVHTPNIFFPFVPEMKSAGLLPYKKNFLCLRLLSCDQGLWNSCWPGGFGWKRVFNLRVR